MGYEFDSKVKELLSKVNNLEKKLSVGHYQANEEKKRLQSACLTSLEKVIDLYFKQNKEVSSLSSPFKKNKFLQNGFLFT